MNEEIKHLLGYLSQQQINDAVASFGEAGIRDAMRSAGWEDSYSWPSDFNTEART